MNIDVNRLPVKGYGYIYMYTSPSGKSYIGQTSTSLIKRSGKRGKLYRNSTIFYKAIVKYGFSAFTVEILGEYPLNQLDQQEQYWIQEKNTLIPNGYNIEIGGINNHKKENPVYAYNLDGTFYKKYFNHAEARCEFDVNGSDIEKCISGKLRFVRGKIWTNVYYESVEPVTTTKNGGKPVAQIDPITNEIINIYPSASAAARDLGLSRSTGISKCCNGKAKLSGGYKWQFFSKFND